MNEILAFVATHGVGKIMMWIGIGIVALCILDFVIIRVIPGFCKLVETVLGRIFRMISNCIIYLRNKEEFDRQDEMEKWLKRKFADAEIDVKIEYIPRHDGLCILNDGYLKDILFMHSKGNLSFRAQVPPEKVEPFKKIMGILMNKFPWVKLGVEGFFLPYRYLDRAWAIEYNLQNYAQPQLSDLCECGCNKVRIVDFIWRSLNETDDWEMLQNTDWTQKFDCRTWNRDDLYELRHYDRMLGRDMVVELSHEQRAKLESELRQLKQLEAKRQRR